MCKKECNIECEKILLDNGKIYEVILPHEDDIKCIVDTLDDIDNFVDLCIGAGIALNTINRIDKSVEIFESLTDLAKKMDDLAKSLNVSLKHISDATDMLGIPKECAGGDE